MLPNTRVKYKIRIGVEPKSNRLVIDCPYAMNEHVKALPNRRWDPNKKVWVAPMIRQNVERIEALVARGVAEFDMAAELAVDQYWKEKEVEESAALSSAFPAWYKYKTEPRWYQKEALSKLYGRHVGALFMDMRTGKSKTGIDWMSALRMEGTINAVLIWCRFSLRRDWLLQLELHCPLPYSVLIPDTTQKSVYEKWFKSQHDFKWMIVGIESMSAGGMASICARFLDTHSKVAGIVDESSKIRNPTKIRSKRIVDLGAQCVRRVAKTGTPMTKGPMNLFMQFQYLDPDIIGIGDYYSFRNRYAVMGGYENKQIVGYDHLDELSQIVAPYVYEVRRKDAYEIPEPQFQMRTVTMSDEQRAVYKEFRKHGGINHMVPKNVLEYALRLHEICQGFIGIRDPDGPKNKDGEPIVVRQHLIPWDKNPKILEVEDIFEEVGCGVIIWCQYVEEMDNFKLLLQKVGWSWSEYSGRNVKSRDMEKKAFQDGDTDCFLAMQSVGDMGLELSRAHTAIWPSNGRDYESRIQSEARTQSKAQTHSVMNIDIIMERSVDEVYYRALQEKQDLIEYVRRLIRERTNPLDSIADGVV
jgi:hypothetical protein